MYGTKRRLSFVDEEEENSNKNYKKEENVNSTSSASSSESPHEELNTLRSMFPSIPLKEIIDAMNTSNGSIEKATDILLSYDLLKEEKVEKPPLKRDDSTTEEEIETMSKKEKTKFLSRTDSEIARDLNEEEYKPALVKGDSQLARELQKEEELRSGKGKRKIATCPICIEEFPFDNQFLGESCFHPEESVSVCRDCVTEYVKSEVNSSRFPIKCCVPKCEGVYSNFDLELLLNTEEMKRVERLQVQRLLNTSSNWFPCLKVGCEDGILFDEWSDFTRFTCNTCKSIWCVKCKDAFHDGETCERFQEWKKENGDADNELQKLIKQGEVKLCPQCQTPTQKNGGCNFLTCHRCQSNWCWYCGENHEVCNCGQNEHKE